MPASITNSAIINYNVADAAGVDATHIGLYTALTSGTFLGGVAMTSNTSVIQDGERYRFAASAITFTVANGDFTAAMAEKLANGAVLGGLFISLHTGDPGSNGADEVTPSWYARASVAANAWTVTTS